MFGNWASDGEVTKFLTWPTHESVEVTGHVVGLWYGQREDPRSYQWAIEPKDLHEPIGSISATKVDDRTGTATVGYCIGRRWWGQGITAEALEAVIAFFFEEVGMNCVTACHDPRNPNSGKVMRKCGMTREGTWRAGGVNNQGICARPLPARSGRSPYRSRRNRFRIPRGTIGRKARNIRLPQCGFPYRN